MVAEVWFLSVSISNILPRLQESTGMRPWLRHPDGTISVPFSILHFDMSCYVLCVDKTLIRYLFFKSSWKQMKHNRNSKPTCRLMSEISLYLCFHSKQDCTFSSSTPIKDLSLLSWIWTDYIRNGQKWLLLFIRSVFPLSCLVRTNWFLRKWLAGVKISSELRKISKI